MIDQRSDMAGMARDIRHATCAGIDAGSPVGLALPIACKQAVLRAGLKRLMDDHVAPMLRDAMSSGLGVSTTADQSEPHDSDQG